VRFREAEIEAARRLRQAGLSWHPRAGHYVFDETKFCKQTSPFQDQVYFILNYSYFMETVGGVERFKEIMLWLPTWDDLREMLSELGVADVDVAAYLNKRNAIESREERLSLYELVESCLTTAAIPPR
jgi:hypothetical protein